MITRLDVEFVSDDATCRAWLYLPKANDPRPVVVLAHGLGGIREMRLDAYAERFTAAGYACLVFDYRHFGASDGQPRQLLDIDRQLADWSAAIAFARSRADVDAARIILWGTSFGGGHVIVAAAREAGIAAVISQCPFTDGIASALAADPQTLAKMTVRALADVFVTRLGKDMVTVSLAGPPKSAALMTAPDSVPGYLGLVPDGAPHRNEVAARVALHIPLHRPGRYAKRVDCPLLFCVCETDTVAPATATLRHARTAPRGEVRLYPEGHFDIYVGAAFERAVCDQIAFLRRHVPVGT
ncbi:MAG: alpha/beta fold hydrolase [Mycobacteriaceae bacterium]|nr:alpha/beta fold hydrolase [Mycobacteriaceae bacterium]MBV9641730.1 alpha/beta fold hydrolase [Mycobacteriaceae bacterium]